MDETKNKLSADESAPKKKTLTLKQASSQKLALSGDNLKTKDGGKFDVKIKGRRRSKPKITQDKQEAAPPEKPTTSEEVAVVSDEETKTPATKTAKKKTAKSAKAATEEAAQDLQDVKQKTKPKEKQPHSEVEMRQSKGTETRKGAPLHEKDKKKRHTDNGAGEEAPRKAKGLRKDRAGRLSRGQAFGLDEETPRRRKIRSKIKRSSEMAEVGAFEKPDTFVTKEIEIPNIITVGELAKRMSVKTRDLITTLFKMGVIKTINEALDQDTAILCVEEIGHKAKPAEEKTIEEKHFAEQEMSAQSGSVRAPVVTVMGHVDHGKTSLLDFIRNTQVADNEAGNITQHIGAYHVDTEMGGITFLDTPGHADFTAMRARGTQLTDIVVLVIACDDGVMPQTVEAIQHAKSAQVPIVTAITKVDLENQDLERIKADMAANDLAPEEWGGDTQIISVSAKTGNGIKELLEAINLQAELLELKAVADTTARGHIIESSLSKGRGPVSTLLIANGTLKIGDVIVAGEAFGRVRAMLNEHGQRVKEAAPSLPVEVLGFNAIPEVGDAFAVVVDEKKARELADFRHVRTDEQRHLTQQAARLDNIFKSAESSEKTTLNLILKTDVRGSLEAIEQSIRKLNTDHEEIQVNIINSGVGGISESDALFAHTSNAALFGFNVRADSAAKKIIERYDVPLRYYSIIYELVDHLKVMLSEMMAPELSEEIVGTAEVRDVFNSQRYGLIAGCIVVSGSVHHHKPVRVLRDNIVIYEGKLESLRRDKEDVEEVRNGVECGIGIRNYQDVRVGDVIENFDVKEIARSL